MCGIERQKNIQMVQDACGTERKRDRVYKKAEKREIKEEEIQRK